MQRLISMDLGLIRNIFSIFQAENPEPETELKYHDHFTLLVAVMLSAQATDVSVNKVTPNLFALANTPEAMANLPLEVIEKYLQTINFYKTKAKNLKALSQRITENYQGCVPARREDLESLPGVGRKTANVVLSIAFHQPTLAVDTHIHRVANRIGFCKTNDPQATEKALLEIIPAEYLKNAHHWLILHGRYVCKARKPACPECSIRKFCTYPDKSLA